MEQKRAAFTAPSGVLTELVATAGSVWLASLHGMAAGRFGADLAEARGLGLFALASGDQTLDPSDFTAQSVRPRDHELHLDFAHAPTGLHYASRWSLCPATGLWSRRDAVRNAGARPVHLRRVLARFVLSLGRYDLFTQESRWCGENQGSWRTLRHGSFRIGCEGARTCQGSSPLLGIRLAATGRGLLFHLLPRGAWMLRATAVGAELLEDPYLVVDAGPADDDLAIELTPGASIELPEILIQELPGGEERAAAPLLHRYVLDTLLPEARTTPPVVYNTWFDVFDRLEPERLERQLEAAAAVGCEVFVVDAGWFGASDESWSVLVGDWREKTNAAFRGRMRDFAAAVRTSGLGFGLWIEPERVRPRAPVFREHPEWLIPASPPGAPPGSLVTDYYPDLANPAAYAYVLGEIRRLVETYELAWIKIDCNFSPARDPRRAAFAAYYDAWGRLLDEIRGRYPALWIEACASGGLRAELETLRHVDFHFLSDTVDPVDVLRIGQGALLRAPPGRLARWLVLRSVGTSIVRYGLAPADTPGALVAPGGAVWEPSTTRGIRFLWAVAAAGVLGVGGDLAGLDSAARTELARLVAAYKELRRTVTRGHARLLTPVRSREDTTGWVAVQISAPASGAGGEEHLLFVYRLDDGTERRAFSPEGLTAGARYVVEDLSADMASRTAAGRELARGVEVVIDRRFDARVVRLRG